MKNFQKLLLISSSKVHNYGYLEQPSPYINEFLSSASVKTLLFIPYASNAHEEYTQKIQLAFEQLKIPINVRGINESTDPAEEICKSEAIFIGGGNTFLLLKTLYDLNLVDVIRKRVLQDGIPYIGISAGTNVATVSINTTNDMPIVYPKSFDALNLVPFNINPHYLDHDPNNQHQGETRQERINEYLNQPHCHPVVGLREGSLLWVENNQIILKGAKPVILFKKNSEPVSIEVGSDLSFLLK